MTDDLRRFRNACCDFMYSVCECFAGMFQALSDAFSAHAKAWYSKKEGR